MTPEGKVKQQIKAYLKSIGARQFWPVQTGYGAPALDCIACINGRYVEIEVKRPGKRTYTSRQAIMIDAVIDAGGISFVTDSLEFTKQMLQRYVVRAYE